MNYLIAIKWKLLTIKYYLSHFVYNICDQIVPFFYPKCSHYKDGTMNVSVTSGEHCSNGASKMNGVCLICRRKVKIEITKFGKAVVHNRKSLTND